MPAATLIPGNQNYASAVVISNTNRIAGDPPKVFMCKTAGDVSSALLTAAKDKKSVTVKSGGHQHEGHCRSGDSYMINVSSIRHISHVAKDVPAGTKNRGRLESLPAAVWQQLDQVWSGINGVAFIGTGANFGDIYAYTDSKGFIISGGGCESVSLGGFAQGGGWGLLTRYLGLGCQNIIGVHMVLPNGDVVCVFDKCLSDANAQSLRDYFGLSRGVPILQDPALLKAIRGGGGGNFGVVVHYFYRIQKADRPYIDFQIQYAKIKGDNEKYKDGSLEALHNPAMRRKGTALTLKLFKQWEEFMHTAPPELTTSFRFALPSNRYGRTPPTHATGSPGPLLALVLGRFYGEMDDLLTLMMPFCDGGDVIDRELRLKGNRCRIVFTHEFSRLPCPREGNVFAGGMDTLLEPVNDPHGDLGAPAKRVLLTAPYFKFWDNFDFVGHGRSNNKADIDKDANDAPPACSAFVKARPKAPTSTCSGSAPHQVSSCYPKLVEDGALPPDMGLHIFNAMGDRVSAPYAHAANRFVSNHHLGGNVARLAALVETSFDFTRHAYIIQPQCWWAPRKDAEDEAEYNLFADEQVEWVRDVRKSLTAEDPATKKVPAAHGAFINFPDAEVPIAQYYPDSIGALRAVKGAVDHRLRLDFPLGVDKL